MGLVSAVALGVFGPFSPPSPEMTLVIPDGALRFETNQLCWFHLKAAAT